MLLVAVLGPTCAEALRALTEEESFTFSHLSTSQRDAGAMFGDLDTAGRTAADVLLLDVSAGPAEAMLEGLDRYRLTRPAVRVVLLASGRQPGDPLVAQLVGMGVGDVINAELADLAASTATVLSRPPAGYAEMRRWRTLTTPGAAPAVEPKKKAEATPETIRVLAQDQRRPWTVVVAGADRGVGASDLSWNLALAIARQGLRVALLTDLPTRTAQAVESTLIPPGFRLSVVPYERDPEALAPKDRAGWQLPDRVRTLLELSGRADVAVVDVGNLAEALEREPQVLAVSDRALVCWPQSDVRLQSIFSTLAMRKPAWVGYLPQATHLAYLVPTSRATIAAEHLFEGIRRATGIEVEHPVPVPVSAQGLDMAPLLDHMAPRQGKESPRRGNLPGVLRGGRVAALARHRSGGMPGWLEQPLDIFWRGAAFAAVLWLAGGVAAYFDLPIPDWWPGASRVATLMRGAWAVVSGGID